MIQAERTTETSVYLNKYARCFIPDGCHIRTRRRENLKSHRLLYIRMLRYPTAQVTESEKNKCVFTVWKIVTYELRHVYKREYKVVLTFLFHWT
jgi:hypothetical protein